MGQGFMRGSCSGYGADCVLDSVRVSAWFVTSCPASFSASPEDVTECEDKLELRWMGGLE